MDLRDYWSAVTAGWKMILAALVVAAVAAVMLNWPTTPQYVSSTRLFVAAQNGSEDLDEFYQRNAVAQQGIASYVVLATSGSVTDEVSEALGYPVANGSVQASVVPGTVVMEVTVTDADPERAQEIAAAYGVVLPEIIEEYEQVGSTSANVRLQVIDEANLPASPVPTPLLRNVLSLMLLGLGAGVGAAVLRYVLRRDAAPTEGTLGAG